MNANEIEQLRRYVVQAEQGRRYDICLPAILLERLLARFDAIGRMSSGHDDAPTASLAIPQLPPRKRAFERDDAGSPCVECGGPVYVGIHGAACRDPKCGWRDRL